MAVYAGDAKKLKVKKLNDKDRALNKGTILQGVLIFLYLWSLGIPMLKEDFLVILTRGSWDISDYRPTRGSEEFPLLLYSTRKNLQRLQRKKN
jgi:hypothetical protein